MIRVCVEDIPIVTSQEHVYNIFSWNINYKRKTTCFVVFVNTTLKTTSLHLFTI